MESKSNFYIGKSMSFDINELNETDSTNAALERILESDKLHEGFVLKSNFQSEGKGMLLNTWESEHGKNLLFSLLLYPDFLKAHEQFYLSKCLSLALVFALNDFLPGKKCLIKWPNDIIVDRKKISGTLIKSSLKGEKIQYSILGCGININQSKFKGDFKATSMFNEGGNNFIINNILKLILDKFDYYYTTLRMENRKIIDQNYISNLFGFDYYQNYITQEGEQLNGKITSILEDGRMILIDSNDKEHCFDIKEISLVQA